MRLTHLLVSASFGIAVAGFPSAAAKVFTGGENGGNTSWHVDTNWLPGGVPGASDIVRIDNHEVWGGHGPMGGLTLGSNAGDNAVLHLTGDVFSSGDIIVGDGGRGELVMHDGSLLSVGSGAGRIIVGRGPGSEDTLRIGQGDLGYQQLEAAEIHLAQPNSRLWADSYYVLLLTMPVTGPGAVVVGEHVEELRLLGANTYSGGTRVEHSRVYVERDAGLGAPSAPLHLIGGTLRIGGTDIFVTSRPLHLEGQGTLRADAGTLGIWNGPVEGSSLRIVGEGEWMFGAATEVVLNSISVSTGGTLRFSQAGHDGGEYALLDLAAGMSLSAGSLVFRIGGTERGLKYDALNLGTGLSFSEDARIVVELKEGFAPQLNDTFLLVSAEWISSWGWDSDPTDTISFQFERAALPEGLVWDTSAFKETGTITVIPEPRVAAVWAGLIVLVAVFLRRR
ncbi:MAG: hypothetical protein JJU00_01005 [Opitutales bacterium]|nr:hypothetical protein [Opitutales bacterium]